MQGGEDLLEEFWRHQAFIGHSEETRKRVATTLRAFVRDTGCQLLEARARDIQEWLTWRNVEPRTSSAYLSYLASFYRWAIYAELTERDPTRGVRRPKVKQLLPRPASDADLAHAIRNAPDARMRAWLCLAAFEGMRVKEIAAVAADDLLVEQDPPFIRVHGKGGKERMVPLHPDTEFALREYGIPGSGPLFRRQGCDCAIRGATVTKYMSRYLRGQGLRFTPHQLRHWFGTTVYNESGGDLRLVQELLGHSSPATTAIYTRVNPKKGVAVVRALSVEQRADAAT